MIADGAVEAVATSATTDDLPRIETIMFHSSTFLIRAVRRTAVGLAAAATATVALPGPAHAHVTIQPGSAEGGGFSVVAFRVPNERDDASTTRIQVTLPEDQPIGSVQTTPVPGWRVSTTTRKLDEPIDMFGEQLDRVVSKVTWTALDGGVRPGQFQDFDLSLGPLPESGDLTFQALQTYSSGEKVNWNEVSADGTTEPEHPAPVLSITAAGSTEAAGGQADPAATASENGAGASASSDEGGGALPVALSGIALVVALGAAALAWRRGRPAQRPEDGRPEAGASREAPEAQRPARSR